MQSDQIGSIEPAITKLFREWPHRDHATLDELHSALSTVGTPLARAIARVLRYLGEDAIDPGIALPAVAEACATLVGSLTTPSPMDRFVLEAAQFRIETLEPARDKPSSLVPLRVR